MSAPVPIPDYIIAGGGTAGLVLANRLTEDPEVHVLVLEAGEDQSADPRVNVPAFWTSLLQSDVDWQYKTVPQDALRGRTIETTAGKILGGSSAINGLAFIGPSKAGYDAWEQLGNPGWGWDDLLPYHKKSYTLLPPDQQTQSHLGVDWISDKCKGTSGPLKVAFPGTLQHPLCGAWVDAFRSLNMATTADPFSGSSVGGYNNAATFDPDTQTRSYAVSAYGRPAFSRSNLRVLTRAQAIKVLLEETSSGTKKATSVLASINGSTETLAASREIILTAGALNTPKLLELSGVGGRELLERHGIPLAIDLPGVGENLQDHVASGVSYEAVDSVVTVDALLRKEPEALAKAQKEYMEHRSGPFTIGGFQSHAFMPTPEGTDLSSFFNQHANADDELMDAARSIIQCPGEASAAWLMFLVQATLHDGKRFSGSNYALPGKYISFGLILTHPLSRGSTHISSDSIDAMPHIDPQYLSHPADLELAARHLQAIEGLRNAKALSAYLKPNGQRNHEDAFKIDTIEGAKKYFVDTATTAYHFCGTAAMLPRAKGGVVDSALRVHGTENLRVVDASIFPLIPRGNIQSSVYAVAEKAADIIRGA